MVRKDFIWDENAEPHSSRRKMILEKHPEIRSLFGPDPRIAYMTLVLATTQIVIAYYIRNAESWLFYVVAHVIGGTISHMLSLGCHELSHNNAFDSTILNVLTGCFANFGQGLPSAETFKKYHLEHHRAQGLDGIDVDLPTELEARLIKGPILKFLFLSTQPLFYALRPVLVYPKAAGKYELLNQVSVIVFDVVLIYYWGIYAWLYLFSSTMLGLTFHPVAGHFISEHYMTSEETKQETFSYYGSLNVFAFNVGYHNEHHDFPRISGYRLPQVKKIAPEYYDNLEVCPSWSGILWKFVMEPSMGPFARTKRHRQTTTTAVHRKAE